MTLPIRTRLTLVYCAVFCASTLFLEVGAYYSVRSGIDLILDREMQARLGGVQDFLNEHVCRRTLPRLQSELAKHAALQPHFLRITDGKGQVIYSGDGMSNQVPLRLLSARWKGAGTGYNLSLGTDLTLAEKLLLRFRLLIFTSSPIVLAAAATAGYFISKRALRPASEMTFAARSITAADLSRRLTVPDGADEFRDLAETLNGMLGRIEDAFRHGSQFTANASHELRTPVALIRMTSEVALLRTNGTPDTYCEALHRILRESEKNLTLRYQSADAPVSVAAHPEHLKRLWLILLDNAIKYTPQGGAISVSVHHRAAGRVCCEVKDTGAGIAPSETERIFECFYRADRARSRDDGGSGLGLAIARWIANTHHATIEVASVLGEGSVFRVSLPVSSVPESRAVELHKELVSL